MTTYLASAPIANHRRALEYWAKMREITKSHGQRLEPVKLYLDDLERIVEVLRSVSSDIRITTGQYALDNLGELPLLKREFLRELEITIREPHVSLECSHSGIWLYISDDNPISRGLFDKVREILLQRRRLLAPLGFVSGLGGALFSAGLFALFRGMIKAHAITVVGAILCLALAIGAIWYSYWEQERGYAIIIPKYEMDAPSFLKRNADQVALAVISAILGGLIALLLAKLAA